MGLSIVSRMERATQRRWLLCALVSSSLFGSYTQFIIFRSQNALCALYPLDLSSCSSAGIPVQFKFQRFFFFWLSLLPQHIFNSSFIRSCWFYKKKKKRMEKIGTWGFITSPIVQRILYISRSNALYVFLIIFFRNIAH